MSEEKGKKENNEKVRNEKKWDKNQVGKKGINRKIDMFSMHQVHAVDIFNTCSIEALLPKK